MRSTLILGAALLAGALACNGAAADRAAADRAAADRAATPAATTATAADSIPAHTDSTSASTPAPSGARPAVVVYKSPSCGCCGKWVDYMKAKGYAVTVRDLDDADLEQSKLSYGVPADARSCHTAVVGGYVIEGHVPAEVVDRLLREKPPVAGVAVPGMVTGSPGMEMPGTPPEHYDVVAFDKAGKTSVYAKY